MKLTDLTRSILTARRQRSHLESHGYEEIGERGGRLWELHRGCRMDHRIVDVVVAADGKTLFAKIEKAA